MTNRKCVTMQYSLIGRLHLGIQPTESQCQHIFRKDSLLIFYSMTNRQWVTLLIILAFCSMTYREWVTLHIFLKYSLMTSCLVTNREWVTLHMLLKCSLITLCPMTNSMWVILHISLKGRLVTSLWPIGSVCPCKFVWKAVSSPLLCD